LKYINLHRRRNGRAYLKVISSEL